MRNILDISLGLVDTCNIYINDVCTFIRKGRTSCGSRMNLNVLFEILLDHVSQIQFVLTLLFV